MIKIEIQSVDSENSFERGVISFNFLNDNTGCSEENYWAEGRVEAERQIRIWLSDLYKMIVGEIWDSLEQRERKVEKKRICYIWSQEDWLMDWIKHAHTMEKKYQGWRLDFCSKKKKE